MPGATGCSRTGRASLTVDGIADHRVRASRAHRVAPRRRVPTGRYQELVMTERSYVRVGPFEDPQGLAGGSGYEQTREIDSLDASELTQEDFFRHYVIRNRPCRLRGAALGWSALDRWRDPDYFKRGSNDRRFEMRRYLRRPDEAPAGEAEGMSLHEILERMKHTDAQFVVEGCEFGEGASLADLRQDIGRHAFLARAGRPRANPPYRASLYRGSCSDWYLLAADEMLLTQVVGAKEMLILPPEDISWRALPQPAHEPGCLLDADLRRHAEFAQIRPYRVLVEPGDALYVPMFWWHAVESVGKQFGVTLARAFASPLQRYDDRGGRAAGRPPGRPGAAGPFASLIASAIGYAIVHTMMRRPATLSRCAVLSNLPG
ncbi:hypothetical protein F3J11_23530 [Burkholderia sp. Cy-647]|nr:hypothetical protein [Burkholderia sp. Tr-860]NIF65627.1 hypothetical protein [Burkholderia sp. Cy-647]NIF96063.1 hypothetical protein [Burkholderia sp. Ax-1720]